MGGEVFLRPVFADAILPFVIDLDELDIAINAVRALSADVPLIALKSFPEDGSVLAGSYPSDVATRITAHGVTVLGNRVIVAAAGNEKYDMLAFPAAIPAVVSVASVDKNGRQAYFSNSGNGLDIAAPGVGLTTAWGSNMAAKVSGTSQSTGIVSGAIAAYLSWGVRSTDVVRQLEADARATGAPPNQVGSGTLFLRSH